MKALFLILFLTLCLGQPSRSQDTDSLPIVGKPIPFFELNDVTHYSKTQVTNNDFRGKWLILDFWFTGCVSCIKSFPKTSKLQAQFKDDIQFVTVGLNDRKYNAGIEKLYEGLREKMKLGLVSAYDSILFKKWKINAMPYMIIVNPDGVVYAITDGRDIDQAKLQALVEGKEVKFYNETQLAKKAMSQDSLDVLVFHSSISEWQPGDHPYFFKRLDVYPKYGNLVGCKVNRATLKKLFLFAFTGRIGILSSDPLYNAFYPDPVSEMQDSSLFDANFETGKNIFNYELIIKRDSIDSLQLLTMIQQDLHRAFGFTAHVEKREMPVWKLTARPDAIKNLRTKGGEAYFSNKDGSGGATGFEAKNFPVSNFLQTIMRYINNDERPCFNCTDIEGNIDISIDALMTDKRQIIRELKRNGLNLILEKRLMSVIIISD